MRFLLLLFLSSVSTLAEPARIHVFIALADNKSQGILPVPAKIGNGNDAAHNLYWGCSDALKPVLIASKSWKLKRTDASPTADILERAVFLHESGEWELTADAYRGTAIAQCTSDFFAALTNSEPLAKFPLVAYLGHNGLMDFKLPAAAIAKAGPGREAIILCCQSQQYFTPHLQMANAKPLLTTTQLMYPGGFILRAALDGWMARESTEKIRLRAATAYASNQKISIKSAARIFPPPIQRYGQKIKPLSVLAALATQEYVISHSPLLRSVIE